MMLSVASCGQKASVPTDDKVVLHVDSWPDKDSAPADYERMMNIKADFEAANPDITIEPDTWRFSTDSFLPKAAANQLPDVFYIPFTEVDKVVDAGYAEDITKYMDEYGYTENLADNIKELVTRDGKIYMVPSNAYALGLMANKTLFKEAGLVDENGYVKYPKTFEELGEFAGQIKAKTGKTGFIFPTVKNCGGWHFMPIAWSFGTKFMEEEDGKWVARFASPECEAALNFIKDLKWKYDALSDNMFIDNNEGFKMLASDQGAMWMCDPGQSTFNNNVRKYGMTKDAMSVGLIPEGPAGRYTLMGGSLYMIPSGTDESVIRAAFKWLEFRGVTYKENESSLKIAEDQFKQYVEEGIPVVDREMFSVWKNPLEKNTALRKQYTNVDFNDYKEYIEFKDVNIKPEEPVCCQELYALLDNCVQAVIENKDADVKQILADAANDFQVNYLDNLN
ncbi:MAG: extracellular solute-binding protein, partial [Eubacteriales bacterium]|nr:extracellular solute-binding protein [Eubacteriales bacterium]